MRAAALYDIHGNLPALEAVLAEINELEVDRIIIGGDVVTGPMPNECMSVLRDLPLQTHYIHGNTESDILLALAGKELKVKAERGIEIVRWSADKLDMDHRLFISDWPMTFTLEDEESGKTLFCHATPNSDQAIITRYTPVELLLPVFAGLDVDLVVCGHTHMQFDRHIGDIRVVNAGSVGMPFGGTGAYWLLIDDGVEFKHTEYDLEAAAERIRNTDYILADDFAENNILSSPSEVEILNMLAPVEIGQPGALE